MRKIRIPTAAGPRELTIRIPANTTHNALLRLAEQGPNGTDVFVRVSVTAPSKQPVPAWFSVGFVVVVVAAIITFTQANNSDTPTSSASSSSSSSSTSYKYPSSTYSYPTTSYTPYSYTPLATTSSAPASETTVEAAPEDSVGVGGCLKNNGTDTSPQMEPAPCKAGAFKVLARKPGAIFAASSCSGVPRTTHDYSVEKYTVYTRNGVETMRIPTPSESYVLCLRKL